MKRIIFAIIILSLASTVYAQTPATGTSKIGWDQSATTLAEAQAYTYKYYPDSATTGVTLTSVTCIGTTSPYQCEVPFPAFTPGSHALTLTTSNEAGESAKSSVLNFKFVVVASAPTNLKIK